MKRGASNGEEYVVTLRRNDHDGEDVKEVGDDDEKEQLGGEMKKEKDHSKGRQRTTSWGRSKPNDDDCEGLLKKFMDVLDSDGTEEIKSLLLKVLEANKAHELKTMLKGADKPTITVMNSDELISDVSLSSGSKDSEHRVTKPVKRSTSFGGDNTRTRNLAAVSKTGRKTAYVPRSQRRGTTPPRSGRPRSTEALRLNTEPKDSKEADTTKVPNDKGRRQDRAPATAAADPSKRKDLDRIRNEMAFKYTRTGKAPTRVARERQRLATTSKPCMVTEVRSELAARSTMSHRRLRSADNLASLRSSSMHGGRKVGSVDRLSLSNHDQTSAENVNGAKNATWDNPIQSTNSRVPARSSGLHVPRYVVPGQATILPNQGGWSCNSLNNTSNPSTILIPSKSSGECLQFNPNRGVQPQSAATRDSTIKIEALVDELRASSHVPPVKEDIQNKDSSKKEGRRFGNFFKRRPKKETTSDGPSSECSDLEESDDESFCCDD